MDCGLYLLEELAPERQILVVFLQNQTLAHSKFEIAEELRLTQMDLRVRQVSRRLVERAAMV